MVSLNDVLLAYSNIPVDDPIAEIWGRGLQGGHKIIEYTGTPPIEITADGNALLDYLIYGNTVQDGTPTPENPADVVGCGELETTGAHTGQYKLPILSNSAVTNIYLGEVETTRRIKKLVLTGKENLYVTDSTTESGTKVFSFMFSEIGMTDILDCDGLMSLIQYPFFYSSHFKQKSNQGLYTDIKDGEIGANTVSSGTYNRWLIFGSSAYTTVKSFKSFLAAQYAAGTPVTVWYVLAEPETGVVNEPLMKIGDYADTVSMEQADVSIPTMNGNTTIDYDGAPKPSQMYIKYRRR